MEVNCPGQRATVLVALACTGSMFMPSRAGNDRNEPPPATAFSTPARNAATTSQTQCQSTVRGSESKHTVFIVEGDGASLSQYGNAGMHGMLRFPRSYCGIRSAADVFRLQVSPCPHSIDLGKGTSRLAAAFRQTPLAQPQANAQPGNSEGDANGGARTSGLCGHALDCKRNHISTVPAQARGPVHRNDEEILELPINH